MAAPSHTDPHPATAHKTITSRLLPNPGSSHLASSTLPFTSVSHLSRSTIRRTIVAGQPPAPGSSAQAVANAKRGGVIPQVAWNAVGVKGQAGLKAKGAGGVGTKPKGKKGGQAGWNRFKPLAKQQVPAFDAPGSVFSHAELVQGHIGGGDGVYHHPGHAFTQAEMIWPLPPTIGQGIYAFHYPLPFPSPLALPPPRQVTTPEPPNLPSLHFSFDPIQAFNYSPNLYHATPTYLTPTQSFAPSPFGPTLAALVASQAMMSTPLGREALLARLPFQVSPEPSLRSPMSVIGGMSHPSSVTSSSFAHPPLSLQPSPPVLSRPPSPAAGYFWPFVAYEGPSEVVVYVGPDVPSPLDLWDRSDDATRLLTLSAPGAVEEAGVASSPTAPLELPLQVSYAAALGSSRSEAGLVHATAELSVTTKLTESSVTWAEPAPAGFKRRPSLVGVEASEPPSPSPFRRASAQLVESPALVKTKPTMEAGDPEAIVVKLPTTSFSVPEPALALPPVQQESLDKPAVLIPARPDSAIESVEEPGFTLVERKKRELPKTAKPKQKKSPLTPTPRAPSASGSTRVLGEWRKANTNALVSSLDNTTNNPSSAPRAAKKHVSGVLGVLQFGKAVQALTKVTKMTVGRSGATTVAGVLKDAADGEEDGDGQGEKKIKNIKKRKSKVGVPMPGDEVEV